MAYVRLIRADRCPPGRGTFVEVDGRGLAVFHLIDPQRFAVIDDACPHAGAHLSTGELTGCTVSCPMHHLQFDVTTGEGEPPDRARVKCYPAQVKDGFVCADLEAPVPPKAR